MICRLTLFFASISITFASLCFSETQDTNITKNASKTHTILIETSMGPIKAELYADKAPITVANFLSYVESGFFDGTIFHRVIPDFMIQGGGFTKDFQEKATKAPIVNEAENGLKNTRGTLAMARTGVVNSATSQFFINTKDNYFLDFKSKKDAREYGYCVFGKVIEGMDVVDKIQKVKRASFGGHSDVPTETVEILSIKKLS